MSLRITSAFVVLVALVGVACSSAAPAPGGKAPSAAKDEEQKDGDPGDKGTGDKKEGSTGDKEDVAPPGESDELKDYLMPFAIHTGFTGGAEKFRVPLETDLTGTLTWKVADPSIADVASAPAPAWYAEFQKEEPDVKLSFGMLTAKKAGTTKVTVSNGTKTFESELTVTAYTTAQVAAGQTRYKTGGTEANRKPCAGCHEADKGPPHSPAWVAELADEDILQSVQAGGYEWEGKKFELNKGNHKWNLSEPEKMGILAYLRSLDPDNFNKMD